MIGLLAGPVIEIPVPAFVLSTPVLFTVTVPPRATGLPETLTPEPALTVIELLASAALGMLPLLMFAPLMPPLTRAPGTIPAVNVPVASTVQRSALLVAFLKRIRLPVGLESVARFPKSASLPLAAWLMVALLIVGLVMDTMPVNVLFPA